MIDYVLASCLPTATKWPSDAPSTQRPQDDVMKSEKVSQKHQPETAAASLQKVQLAIAHRAFELFKMRGCEHGHDWQDWFRAESELLRPVFGISAEVTDECETTAQLLEDLAAHADNDEERQRCLAVAKNFRLVA